MHSFPWNAVLLGEDETTNYPILDRTAGADDLRMWIKALMTEGVYLANADAFAVTPSEGMKVLVSPGMCIIEGTPGQEPNTRELALQASASQDRIDTIVIRWDDNRDVRNMDLYVKTGVASATPVRPTLTRTETIKELGLCDIYIPANTTSVSQNRITDTRLDTARCGMVTAILKIDTTTFFNQLQAQTDIAVALAQSALDGTLAGELQANINAVDEKADSKVSKTGDTMTGSLSVKGTYSRVAIYPDSINVVRDLDQNGVEDISGSLQVVQNSVGNAVAVIHQNRITNATDNVLRLYADKTELLKPLTVSSGGTGTTSLVGANGLIHAMFDTSITPSYLPCFSSSWADGGYTTPSTLRSNMGIADYVTAQGDSGIWHYVKYNSGLAVIYGKENQTGNFANVLNGFYIVGPRVPPALPFTLTNLLSFSAFASDSSANVFASYGKTVDGKTPPNYYISSSKSGSITSQVFYVVVGKWK